MSKCFARFCLLVVALLLGGCAASDKMFSSMEQNSHSFAQKLPEWAGGPKQGLPPKPGDPRYAAYRQQIEGKAAPAPATSTDAPAAPAQTTASPSNANDAAAQPAAGK